MITSFLKPTGAEANLFSKTLGKSLNVLVFVLRYTGICTPAACEECSRRSSFVTVLRIRRRASICSPRTLESPNAALLGSWVARARLPFRELRVGPSGENTRSQPDHARVRLSCVSVLAGGVRSSQGRVSFARTQRRRHVPALFARRKRERSCAVVRAESARSTAAVLGSRLRALLPKFRKGLGKVLLSPRFRFSGTMTAPPSPHVLGMKQGRFHRSARASTHCFETSACCSSASLRD